MIFKRCSCPDQRGCSHPYWTRFEMHGKRYERSTKTTDRRGAERIEIKRKNLAAEGKDDKPLRRVSLTELIRDYTSAIEKEHRSAGKTIRILEGFKQAVGNPDIKDVNSWLIEKFKRERANQVGQSTVNRELTVLRGLFTRAISWNLLTASPLAKVKDYDVDDVRIRVLDDAELALLPQLPDDEYLLCRTTLETLARISELLQLRVEHIGPSWVERRVKGGKVIRVQLTDDLRKKLLARAPASGYVFGEGAKGLPPSQQTASTAVIRALQRVGIRDASHHTMRHTGVTLMLEGGINPRTIQRLAGWSSLRMLERYGHARDAEALRAVQTVAKHLDTLTSGGTADAEPATPAATAGSGDNR